MLHAATKIDAHGAVSETGAGGDFRAAHALDEAKDKRFAVGVGERADGIERCVGFGAGMRRMTSGRSELFGLRGGGFFVEFVARFDAAVKIGGAVAGDGGEPTGEAGEFAESCEARQGLEKNVLHKIVYVGEGNSGEENPVNHTGVAGIEKSEGGAVAVLGGANKVVVGAAGFVGSVHGRGSRAGSAEF